MKITVSQLRQLIKEEIKKINEERQIEIKPGFKFFELKQGYTESGRGMTDTIWEVVKDLGNDKYECKVLATTNVHSSRVGDKDTFTAQQIHKFANQ